MAALYRPIRLVLAAHFATLHDEDREVIEDRIDNPKQARQIVAELAPRVRRCFGYGDAPAGEVVENEE